MTTLILSHPACLGHDPGPGHPEAPSRLRAILDAIRGLDGMGLAFAEAPEASIEALTSIHDPAMIDGVLATIPAAGYGMIDHDTVVSPGSRAAALRAAGAALAAVDAVAGGVAANAFCAVRPPGHHATRDRAMGFCLLNTAALAAVHARETHNFDRIAVVDFDVHHGNGTEDILSDREGFFYGSSHEYPNYPGSGRHSEEGPCRIVNVPLAPMTSGAAFRAAWSERILPELSLFRPEFIVVSAGFDGHRKDPLSMMQLEVADFAWLAAELRRIAEDCCVGRLVSVLEGGYDLDALAASARAHVVALASQGDSSEPPENVA